VYKLGQPGKCKFDFRFISVVVDNRMAEIFWDSDSGDNQNHNFNIDTWKAPAPAVWSG
jgi:hypothetical protein